MPWSPPDWITIICSTCVCPWRASEASGGAECSCTVIYISKMAHIIPQFSEFKVLCCFVCFFTFRALHSMGPGYLRDHFFPFISTCPINSSRRYMLWVMSQKELYQSGPKRCVFSAVSICSLEHHSPWGEVSPISISLPESLENIFPSTLEISWQACKVLDWS